MNANHRPSELTLPAASFAALRSSLVESLGTDAAAQALREAGYAAGDALFGILQSAGGSPAEAAATRFWTDLGRLFSSRGWGQLTFTPVHDGVGSLESGDWIEARLDDSPDVSGDQPSCHFTTGVLANMLGHVADAEVAVLEVECRARGDSRCRFLFGGADAVYRVYDAVSSGSAADNVLAELR